MLLYFIYWAEEADARINGADFLFAALSRSRSMCLNVLQCGRSRSTYALLVGVTVFPDSRNPIPLDSHVLLLYVNHVVSCGDISRNLRCVVYCLILNSVNNNRGNFRYNNYSK
jgi:hypothetical protein